MPKDSDEVINELLEETRILRESCRAQQQMATRCVMMLDDAGMGKFDNPASHGNTLLGMVQEACEILKSR